MLSDPPAQATPVLEPLDSPGHPMAAFYADARRRRRLRYARKPAPKVRKRRAIITMVYNEAVFLPLWLGYYSRFFTPQDIYVLDNDTTDGSTDREGFIRVPAPRDRVDATWTRDTIQGLQHELLDRYDIVMVTDVDEFVAPVPHLGTLDRYLDRFDEGWVNCLGYELLHMKDLEGPLDLGRPIMSQRHHWFFNPAYDKATITTEPMQWRVGFHGLAEFSYNLDPDLRLVHLHRMDYEICLQRHRSRETRAWAEVDTEERWALHNRITDEVEFEKWFYDDSCFAALDINVERIPPAWHDVF
jgi:hypothetical protein